MSPIALNLPLTLPLEVVEHILEGVDNRKGLKICSLIAKVFLYPSQKLLFQHVTLSLVPHNFEASPLLTGSPVNSPIQFMDFLISSPTHCSMVSSMHVSGGDIPIEATSTSSWASTIRNIRILLPLLTHLRQVTIESSFVSDWTTLNLDLKTALLDFYTLPTLQHLELRYSTISEQELESLVKIPRLTLVGVNLAPTLVSNHFPLRSETITAASATELKIVLRGSEVAQYLFGLAKAIRATLKSFSWHTSPHLRDSNYVPSEMKLCEFPSLLFFSICIPMGTTTVDDLISMFRHREGFKAVLKAVEVIVDCDNLSDEVVASWDWHGLDLILSSPAYAELVSLSISAKKVIEYTSAPAQGDNVNALDLLPLFRRKLPLLLGNGVTIQARSVQP